PPPLARTAERLARTSAVRPGAQQQSRFILQAERALHTRNVAQRFAEVVLVHCPDRRLSLRRIENVAESADVCLPLAEQLVGETALAVLLLRHRRIGVRGRR